MDVLRDGSQDPFHQTLSVNLLANTRSDLVPFLPLIMGLYSSPKLPGLSFFCELSWWMRLSPFSPAAVYC